MRGSSPDTLERKIAELLASTGWLRRLARRLLGDTHSVDDVVQDTMVAALEAPGTVRDWDAWLTRVVRNKAARHHRIESRRREREQALGSDEVPDTAEIVVQAALQRKIVGLVLDLHEPYRTTVLLRFWEGLRPRQIARRCGVPVDTVYARLRRGLALLRGRLDQGERDWRSALTPFAAAKVASWLTIGGFVMSLPGKLAVAGSLALGTVLLWLWLGSDVPPEWAAPDGEQGNPGSLSASVESGAHEVPVGSTGEGPGVTRTVATEAFVIRGRVENHRKDALANVELRARLIASTDARRPAALEARLRADAQGRFAWRIPRPERSITLIFDHDDSREWSGYARRIVIRGASAPQDVIVLGSYLDLVVHGVVRGPDGEPVAGAIVFNPYTSEEWTTSEDGRYELRSWSISSNATVYCRASGYALVHADVDTGSKPGRVVHDIQLRRGASLRGRVVDEDDAGIAGVRISVGHVFGRVGKTGSDGSFLVDCVDPEFQRYSFLFAHPDYQPRRVSVDADELERELVVELASGIEVSGSVFGPDGRPLPGVEVVVQRPGSGGAASISDDEGRFACRNAARGDVRLRASAGGMATYESELTISAAAPALAGLTIHMVGERSISGIIVDDQGRSVGRHGGVAALKNGRYFGGVARTDAAGRFRLTGLPAGHVDLEVFGGGLIRSVVRGVAAGRTDLRLVLRRAASFAGTVVDDATGEPVPEFVVRFATPFLEDGERWAGTCSSTWFTPGHSFHSDDGTWSTADSGIGEFEPGGLMGIEITAPGHAPAIHRRVAARVDIRPSDFVVRLTRSGSVEGLVVEAASGRAVAGARVRIYGAERPLRLVGGRLEHHAITVLTDRDGRFAIPDAPTGDLSVRVEHPAYAWTCDGPFAVLPGGSVDRVIRVSRGGAIHGSLAAGRTVTLCALSVAVAPDLRVATTAADDGSFRFAQSLPAGSYRVTSLARDGAGGHSLLEARVVVDRADRRVELAAAGSGRLRGPVSGSRGVAQLRPAGDPHWIEVPLVDGTLDVRGLRAGRWEVRGVGTFTARDGEVTEIR